MPARGRYSRSRFFYERIINGSVFGAVDLRRRLFGYPLSRSNYSGDVRSGSDFRDGDWQGFTCSVSLCCFAALVGIGLSFGLAGCGVVASSNSSTPSHAVFAPIGQDSDTGDGARNGESGGSGDGVSARSAGNAAGSGGARGDRHKGDGAATKGAGGTAGGGKNTAHKAGHTRGGGSGVGGLTGASVVEYRPDGGLWFNAEPEDPLDKMVYASQKFVGKPLELPPLEGEDVDPIFLGKPDNCDPQVFERLRQIGFEAAYQPRSSSVGVYSCSFTIDTGAVLSDLVIHVRAPSSFRERASKDFGNDLYAIESGLSVFNCVAIQTSDEDTLNYFAYTDYEDRDQEKRCDAVRKVRQIFNNVYGGKLQ